VHAASSGPAAYRGPMGDDPLVERLLASEPSYDAVDAAAMSELGPYAVLGEFAHHVVDQVGAGRAADVAATFALVEDVLATGSSHEISVVRNGFLETLQNIVSHRDVPLTGTDFLKLLGPRSAVEWHELNETWLLAAAARPEGGAVSVQDYLDVVDPDMRRHLQANRRELTDGRMIGVSDVLAFEQSQAAGIRSATMQMRRVTIAVSAAFLTLLVLAALLAR